MQNFTTAMQKTCDTIAKSHNDRISYSLADLHTSCPPSLAEGVRGWVFYPNAHKRSIQNPNPCHTEGVARNISKSKNVSRDISRLHAQYDNKREASISTKSQYDGKHSVIVSNDSTSAIADNDSASVIASVATQRVAIYPLVIRQTFRHCEQMRLCQK
ncbi:hypothetical protein [Helicobacter sp. T3_23-1056]